MQSAHSAIDFQHQYPEIASRWNQESNYLIFLSVPNLSILQDYVALFQKNNLKYTTFIEPDLGNQLTAVCVEPCDLSKKLCSNLPLMFKKLKTEEEIKQDILNTYYEKMDFLYKKQNLNYEKY